MAYTQQTPIGTPDVNLITKTLAGLQPDSALQQYAILHKNNPYILSLAKSESDRRKQLRTASQGQVGQQPTVADQSIAGMAPAPMMAQQQLPENQGIAQIPTPNMQRMADGGIAGYEDDEEGMATGGMGGMFNFAQQSEPVVRMSGGGHIPRYQGNTMDGSVVTSGEMYQAQLALRAKYEQEAIEMSEGKRMQFSPDVKVFAQQLSKSGNASQADYLAKQQQQMLAGSPLRNKAAPAMPDRFKTPEIASTATPELILPYGQSKATNVLGSAPPADKAPPPPGDKPAPQAKLPTSGPSVKEAQDLGSKFYDLKGIEGKLEQAQMQERQDIANEKETRAAKLEAFNKAQGPAMASYEKLLKGEEMQDATDKEKAGLMSLMKGFLAMAAGESPNAATNIAKGAMAGLGDYGDALKEFKKSAKDRNKAMAEIENARRAEAKGDLKDTQMYEDKANDYMRASKQSGIKAIIDATGKSSEISAGIYKTMVDNASANARTMAQINAPDAQSKFYGNLGGGDPKKGLAYFAETMGPDAKGLQAVLKDYSGMVGEARLKAMETSKDPAERARAVTIRQLQKEQAASGLKPVSVAQDRNLLP
jgi:hypothetical protein